MLFPTNFCLISSSFHVLLLVSAFGSVLTLQKGRNGKDFQEAALLAHNECRAIHNTGDMELTDDLNERADKCAEYYANKGTIDHSCPHKNKVKNEQTGENLFMAWGSKKDDVTSAKDAVKSWYGEIDKYNWEKPGFSPATGHFTQVVWKDSTNLGIGVAHGKNKGEIYVVGLYLPPGNWRGKFPENVPPPKPKSDNPTAPAQQIKNDGSKFSVDSGFLLRWAICVGVGMLNAQFLYI